MRLAEMTWQEVNALERTTVVLVPFGALEQHGAHLTLETDALIAERLATRLDEVSYGRLLVLPVQWMGLSTHHMSFSGTISASVETYLAMASEIIGSIAQAGFQKILVLNAHGGNASALDVVLTKLRLVYPTTRIILSTYWNIAAEQLRGIRESGEGGMGHACELETSLILAEKPSSVRTESMHPDGRWPASRFLAKDMLTGGPVSVSRSFAEISALGAVGDPRTASAEKGEKFFNAIVGQLHALIQDIETGKLEDFRAVGS
jgi:creatinine amidohydrolase